jgi:hypothetical protein
MSWIVITCMIGAAVLVEGIYRLQLRRWRKKFRIRPVLSYEEWSKYFNGLNLREGLAREVCEALGRAIGVHVTQILPQDKFDGDLNFTGWYADPLEEFEDWFINYMKLNGIKEPCKFNGPTVKDFLVELNCVLGNVGTEKKGDN